MSIIHVTKVDKSGAERVYNTREGKTLREFLGSDADSVGSIQVYLDEGDGERLISEADLDLTLEDGWAVRIRKVGNFNSGC